MLDWLIDLFTKPANNYGSNNGGAGRQNNITTKVADNNHEAKPANNYGSNNGGAGRQNTLNTAASKNINQNTYGGTKIKNSVMLNKKEYPVYRLSDGSYYIIKDNKKQQLYGGMALFENLKTDDGVCITITDDNLKKGTGSTKIDKDETVSTNPSTPQTQPANPVTGGATANRAPTGSSSTSGTSTNSGSSSTKTETPVEKPVYEGAEAVAERHGIDYNLANIQADYDQRTQDYYDAATAEYEADRTRYVQASNNYANRIMEEYLDSYANAAATASGRGSQAAAALITDLNTQADVAANDLGMLQTVNNLNEARKAELVNNKFLAEQYYNNLGTYLSQVSTAQYGADVNKYVKAMDAYAQRYAADRALAENEAREASVRYAGLANANLYKSQNASSTATWQRLYNYYLTRYNGNEQMASNAVIKNLGVEGGAN